MILPVESISDSITLIFACIGGSHIRLYHLYSVEPHKTVTLQFKNASSKTHGNFWSDLIGICA